MIRPLLATSLLALTLAACGGDEAEVAVPEAAERPEEITLGEPLRQRPERPAPRAIYTDTLGSFESAVSGLAVWQHPTLSFESAVLAANGEAGLAVIPVDSGVTLSSVEGDFSGGVAVSYPDDGDPSNTLAAAGRGGEIAFYTVGPDRSFAEVAAVPAPGGTRALCALGGTVLRVSADGAASLYGVTPGENAAVAEPVPALDGAAGCAASREGFFVLGADGGVAELSPNGESDGYGDLFGGTPATALAAVTVSESGGYLLAGGADGTIRALPFPLEDGAEAARTAPQREGVTDDAAIAVLAAGSGNFGSIYRDGVVAVLDAEGALKLLPWAGLARALGIEETTTVARRSLNAEGRPEGGPTVPEAATGPEPDVDAPRFDVRPAVPDLSRAGGQD